MAKTAKGDTLEQSLYTIEQAIQAKIDPHQKNIQSLKASIDGILSTAQNAFEDNEKAYHKALEDIKKTYTKKERDVLKSHEDAIKNQEQAIQKAKADHTHQLQHHKDNHHARLEELTKQLDQLEKEKEKTLNNIEEKHAQNTKMYEEKVRMHEENLKENQDKIEADLERLLRKIQKAYTDAKKRLDHVKGSFDEHFAETQAKFQEQSDETINALKNEKNALDYHLNSVRKNYNNAAKVLSNHMRELSDELKKPFDYTTTVLNELNTLIKTTKSHFTKQLDFDLKNEMHRLEKALKVETFDTLDEQKAKSIQKQIDLNQMRQSALSAHMDLLENTVLETTKAIQHVANNTLGSLKSSFDQHDELLETQLGQLKAKFDIFQKINPERETILESFLNTTHPKQHLDKLKDFFESLFAHFYQFELTRLEHLYETTKNLKPHYKEIDEIRAFLDTKDALKEIRTHKEKIASEKKDASLRQEMKICQINHEMNTETIEFNFAKRTLTHQQTIETALEEKRLSDRKQEMKAALKHVKNDRASEEAKAVYALREAHVNTDLKQLDARADIEIKMLSEKHAINKLNIDMDYDLKTAEEKHRLDGEKTRIQLALEEHQSALQRLESQINKKENKLNQNADRKKKQAKRDYDSEKKRLEQALKNEDETHENNINFIQQAFERESADAQDNIQDVKNMILARLTPIEKTHETILQQLMQDKAAIESDEASLKTILNPLKESRKNHITEHIDDTIKRLEEAHEFLYKIDLKALDEEKNTRKKSQLENKLKTNLKRAYEQLDTYKNTVKTRLHKCFKTPLETFKAQEQVPMHALKADTLKALADMKQLLQQFKDQGEQALDNLFKPLYEEDSARLTKAKRSYHQAIDEEKNRYETAKKPLEISLEGLDESYQKDLQSIEEKLDTDKNEHLDEAYETQAKLKGQIDDYQSQIERLSNHYHETLKTETQKKDEAYAQEDEAYAHKKQTIKERFESRKEVIKARLEDAKQIYDHAQANTKRTAEDIASGLEDYIETTQENYNYIKQTETEAIEAIKEEKEKSLDRENSALKSTLDDYEEQILTSKARLESQIETALREINDKIRIKEARQKHLEETIKTKEYGLYDDYKKAHENLQKAIKQTISDHSFEVEMDFDVLAELDELNTEQVDKFIASTLKDITS